jgi:hypothetical protein
MTKMKIPIITEKGIDIDTLEEIKKYTCELQENIMKYGNSIPGSMESMYVKEISEAFEKWYNEYTSVQTIDCVNDCKIIVKMIS